MPQGVSSLVAEISRGKTTVLKEGSITFFPQFLLIIQSTLFASFTCSVRPPNWSSICFLPSCIVWSWSALFISMMLYFSWTIQHYKIYTCHRFQFFALSVHNLSWVLVLCFKLVYLFNWSWKIDSFIVYTIVSVLAKCLFTMWLMTCYVYIYDQITPTRSCLWPAALNFTIYLVNVFYKFS